MFLQRVMTPSLLPAVQDMNTRLLSANLDFDSRLQHVSFCVPDECPDSRKCRVDHVFLCFWSEPRSHVWSGCDERFTWSAVLTRTPVFGGAVIYPPGKLSRVLDISAVLINSVGIW